MKPGPKKTTGTIVTQMPVRPIQMKLLFIECNLSQGKLAEFAGVSRPTVNSCVNKGYIPTTMKGFRERVEAFLQLPENRIGKGVGAWLTERGLTMADIWSPLGERMHRAHPQSTWQSKPAMIPGNPDDIEEEKQMKKVKIPKDVLKHYQLFKDPFADDPRNDKEVFRSEEHRYLEYSMCDSAKNGGFLAVVAECGAGKTVMRRAVIDQLRSDERVRIVFPQIIDKKKVNAKSVCQAIIMDLAPGDKIPQSPEVQARKVKELLVARASQQPPVQVVLIIEEAHKLTIDALSFLKQFHELELGYRKLMGIILLGQPELGVSLDEEVHPEIREVIRRIQIAAIGGLNGGTWDYLALRIKTVGGDIDKIITKEAVKALSDRLSCPGERNKRISIAYPLTVNNYVANAMVLALEMGESIVTVDVVNAL